jgi:lipopolysaccharide transport system permease protein
LSARSGQTQAYDAHSVGTADPSPHLARPAEVPLGHDTAAAAGRPSWLARARRASDVIWALALADLRVRYGRGRVRTVKWLLDPYAAVGVYLLLVAFVMEKPERAAGLSIACAIVPFQLIIMTVLNSMIAVRTRQTIIQNMRFDRTLIPFASTVTEAVGFSAALTLLAVMMAIYGVAPTPAILWLPVLLACTFLLALALAYPVALAGIWFPKANMLIMSVARAAFFVAPGIVALDQIHGAAHGWLWLNPLTGIFESYRSVFLEGHSPAAWQLLVPSAMAIVLLAVVVPLFRSEQRQFARIVEGVS